MTEVTAKLISHTSLKQGSVEKGGEIFLINIFFFPLYHGRKISISVSRIRFTQ